MTKTSRPADRATGDGRHRRAGHDLGARLSFFAACAFAFAVVLNVPAGTLFAVLGTVLVSISCHERARSAQSRFTSELRPTAALVCVALVAALVPGSLTGSLPRWVAAALPLVVIPFAVAELTTAWARRHSIVTGVTIIVVALVTGTWLIQAATGLGLDVVLLHEQAAAAFAQGRNPYSAAVSAPDGAPGAAPGSLIVGYPYPPVAAVVYASSTWLLGDPRWANLASWIVVAVCGLEGFRRRRDAGSALPFLLLAALPAWGMMLQSGWTELLSAALIAVAAITWSHPVMSGIALGAALGSKQYFIVALPLVALYRGAGWQRRAIAAAVTALLPLAAAFAWSPDDAWRSLVSFHAHTAPRSDSSNLAGVLALLGAPWSPPAWLGLGVSLTLGSLLTRHVTGPAGFWRVMATGLAAFFLLSSQAMPNYWFLVAVVAGLGSTRG